MRHPGDRHPGLGGTESRGKLGLPPVLQGERDKAQEGGRAHAIGCVHDVALRADRGQLRGLRRSYLDTCLRRGGAGLDSGVIPDPVLHLVLLRHPRHLRHLLPHHPEEHREWAWCRPPLHVVRDRDAQRERGSPRALPAGQRDGGGVGLHSVPSGLRDSLRRVGRHLCQLHRRGLHLRLHGLQDEWSSSDIPGPPFPADLLLPDRSSIGSGL